MSLRHSPIELIQKNIMSSFVLISFCILFIQFTCAYDQFINFSMYEVTAFNVRERALLYNLNVRNDLIVFVNGITNEAAVPMDILVDAEYTKKFEEMLRDNDIEYIKVKKEKLVKKRQDLIVKTPYYPYARVPNITTEFHSYETLMLWVEFKLKKIPFLRKIIIAKTFEKRELFVLKISTGRRNSAVFLMAGETGRDWISPAILINFVDYILEHKLNVELLTSHYDFYILPMFNPDGYEYSNSKKWSWTKNRKNYFPKKMCDKNTAAVGVNIDRNWFFSNNIIGDEECDPIYSGSKSLSEEETAGLAKFLNSIALHMLTFINVRGFDHLVTTPYGHTSEYCNNYPVLVDILSSVHDRVKEEHNRSFFYGTTSSFFYNYTGNVADWVKKKLNTPIVYTFYMKLDDYILPSPTDVVPLTDEFSTMMKQMLLLASSIYSPLFSNQTRHTIKSIVIIINIVTTLTL